MSSNPTNFIGPPPWTTALNDFLAEIATNLSYAAKISNDAGEMVAIALEHPDAGKILMSTSIAAAAAFTALNSAMGTRPPWRQNKFILISLESGKILVAVAASSMIGAATAFIGALESIGVGQRI